MRPAWSIPLLIAVLACDRRSASRSVAADAPAPPAVRVVTAPAPLEPGVAADSASEAPQWGTLPPSDSAGRATPYVSPARIAALPAPVLAQLESRGCLVPVELIGKVVTPQAFRAALYERGAARDWAVACSRPTEAGRASTLLVFRAARSFAVDSLPEMGPDELHGPFRMTKDTGFVSDNIRPEHFASPLPLRTQFDDAEMKTFGVSAWEGEQLLHDAVLVDVGVDVRWYWTGRRWLRRPFAD